MLNNETLRNIINKTDLKQADKVLIALSYNVDSPKSIRDIRKIAIESGLREIDKWNIYRALTQSKKKGFAVLLKDGWILTDDGKAYVAKISGINNKRKAIKNVAIDLHRIISVISDINTHSFLNEAVSCFEYGNYRAAVVLSWVGAISILYKHVFDKYLVEFNNEGLRRDPKWKDIKAIDDFCRIKEKDFLDIIEAISVIGKNTKQELKICLDFRNACGHPNTLVIGENRVAAHLETLILNIYSKF